MWHEFALLLFYKWFASIYIHLKSLSDRMFDKRMTSQFELYILFGFLFTICGECKEEGLKFYCDLGSPVIPLYIYLRCHYMFVGKCYPIITNRKHFWITLKCEPFDITKQIVCNIIISKYEKSLVRYTSCLMCNANE